MSNLRIVCLGSQDMTPIARNDCSHYLLNEKILIDCGTSPVMNLLNAGIDIGKITHIVFTHFHPDHFIGFASLIYYLSSVANVSMPNITIYGPTDRINELIEKTYGYIGYAANRKRPKTIGLGGNEKILLNTNGNQIIMSTTAARHAVPGLCLKFASGGKTVGFSGDTSYFPELDDFFRKCNAIIHECSFPDNCNESTKLKCGHSDPKDAATLAENAEISKVYLTHAANGYDSRIESFKKYSNIPVEFIKSGDVIEI